MTDWLTAVGTLLAVAIALYLAIRDARRTQKLDAEQNAEKQSRKEAEERAQAECVAAWMDRDDIAFQNASKLPVYRVRMWLHMRDEDAEYAKWRRIIPPSGDEPTRISLIREALEKVQAWRSRREGEKRSKPAIMVELTFRDARGDWWRRAEDGLLERADESSARNPRARE